MDIEYMETMFKTKESDLYNFSREDKELKIIEFKEFMENCNKLLQYAERTIK